MDSDRHHRSIPTSSTPHLFFCFTSSSSSSMKISSKSILSPGRPGSIRDPPQISLSNSASRRLRTSRSIKGGGGASPAMFPVTGKKRGCGFDNPEPSSPKVTCIGQVRVKSKKKHAKNLRNLSRRRRLEHSGSQRQHLEFLQKQRNNNNNQKWVHLPLTICESLRAFGSEVSCLFPCRNSCSATEKEDKIDLGFVEQGNRGSYGVSAQLLVALQDEDDEIEDRNTRRHVFENLEIVNDNIIGSNDEGRVSICVPPKNALLLMRCRSDPMMMEVLTNRFWEPNVEQIHEVKEEDEEFADFEDKIEENNIISQEEMVLDEVIDQEDEVFQEMVEVDSKMEVKQSTQEEEDEEFADSEDKIKENVIPQEHFKLQEDEKQMVLDEVFQEMVEIDSKIVMEMEVNQSTQEDEHSIEAIEEEEEDEEQSIEEIEEKEEESMFLWSLFEENAYQDHEFKNNDEDDAQLDRVDALESFENEDVQETETGESNIEKVQLFEEEKEEMIVTEFTKRYEIPDETHEEIEVENGVLERENEERERNNKELPECLLLMLYEPKLSMEVSKETWVCSSDFIRHHSGRKKPPHPPPPPPPPQLPPHQFESVEGQDESKIHPSAKGHADYETRTATVQDQPVSQQRARSSCSLLAPPSLAAMLEQKLVNTIGFEPLVLTRCNSEPVRTTTSKLAPETCFWRNKLEPPRRASFGVGIAGLGF